MIIQTCVWKWIIVENVEEKKMLLVHNLETGNVLNVKLTSLYKKEEMIKKVIKKMVVLPYVLTLISMDLFPQRKFVINGKMLLLIEILNVLNNSVKLDMMKTRKNVYVKPMLNGLMKLHSLTNGKEMIKDGKCLNMKNNQVKIRLNKI